MGSSVTTISWVVLCESISRDRFDRISLLGVASHMPVPSLPLVLNEHMVVARLSHVGRADALDVAFGVSTPAGLWVTPDAEDAATVAIAGEYVLIRLHSLPLREEGVHRFEVGLSNGAAASVDVPVWLCEPDNRRQPVH